MRIVTKYIIAAVATALILASCVSMSKRVYATRSQPDVDPAKAYLYARQTGETGKTADRLMVELHRVSDGKVFQYVLSGDTLEGLFELEAGEYEIFAFYMYHYRPDGKKTILADCVYPDIPKENLIVEPGTITYIGTYTMTRNFTFLLPVALSRSFDAGISAELETRWPGMELRTF